MIRSYPIAAAACACLLAFTVAFGFAGAAQAQQFASTNKSVHLRAGPARSYPVVAILPPGASVTVYGCLQAYTWCDVLAGPDRGWVYAGNLTYPYGGRDMLLPGVAAAAGIVVTPFLIENYWRDNYTARWWWPQRRRWYPPPRMPPIRMEAPHRGR